MVGEFYIGLYYLYSDNFAKQKHSESANFASWPKCEMGFGFPD